MLENVKNYKGTFMSDTLPSKIESDASYVVNLDKDINDGTHWTSIFNSPKLDYVCYFDSFGQVPNKDTEKFLRTSGKSIKFNTTPYQHILSNACGYFGIYFINEMSKQLDMYDVLSKFDITNAVENEKIIRKYFKL